MAVASANVTMRPAPVFFTEVYRRGGDMDGDILRRAERVAVVAKGSAPIRSGRLAASIRVNRRRNRVGQYDFGYEIRPTVYYAAWALDPSATHPHIIQGTPYLAFDLASGDHAIVKGPIMHPGTKKRNDFMIRALRSAAR